MRKRTAYQLGKLNNRAHIVTGLLNALTNIDVVIAMIRSSDSGINLKLALRSKFNFSEEQVNIIRILFGVNFV